MTTITACLHSRLPFALASEYFREGLTEVSKSGLHEVELTTRVPITKTELSKNVLVECLPDSSDPESWEIRWTPEPGGVYPSFEGKISARINEANGTTILELTGKYAPPFGIAGEIFDHVVGKKLALETAQDLLANLAGEMRVRYAFEEAHRLFDEAESP